MLLKSNIEKGQPRQPVEIMTIKLIDETSVRKGIFPESAGQDCLEHQLNSISGEVISIGSAPCAEKKLGILQLRFSQFDQASLIDLGHGYTATSALMCGCGS